MLRGIRNVAESGGLQEISMKGDRFMRKVIFGLVLAIIVGAAVGANGGGCTARKVSAWGKEKPKAPWRALADYPRPPAPDTGWGIHDVTNCVWVPEDADAFFKELKSRYGFSWFKVLACGANKIEVVKAARRQGVEPVVRIYAPGPHPNFPRPGEEEATYRKLVKDYVAAGAHYIEAGNEPNLSVEWDGEYEESKKKSFCVSSGFE